MENDLNSFHITKEKLLQILLDAYNLGNNVQNITLERMLDYLEKKLN